MAITIKPNQALGFNVNDDCKCGGDYCQPIQTTDQTMLQGIVNLSSDINLVSDGDFADSSNWSLDSGWSISGGALHAINIGGGSTADSILPLGLIAGRLYAFSASINIISQGSSTSGQGVIIKINNQTVVFPDGNTAYNQSIQGDWLFIADSITSDIIQFSTNENTIDFDITDVSLNEVSEIGLGIYNSSNILQDSYTVFSGSNSLKYYVLGQQIDETPKYLGSTDTPLFELLIDDWASLTSYIGCGYIKIYDTVLLSQRVRNGTFTGSLDYWDVGGGWAYSGSNSASYTTGFTLLEQELSLMGGNTYTLTFSITNLGLGNNMALYLNGSFAETFTGNGTQTYTLDLTSYSGLQSITLGFTGSALGDHVYILDNVSVVGSEIDSLNVSECFNLRETHPCTLLFYAYNSDNAFGFDYTSGALRHYLRLEAKMDVSGYPEEKEEYLFSDNSRELLFARSETEYEINVTDAPDYIHACLRMMRLNDGFYIDGTQYIADGNYDLKRRKTSKLKQSLFTVKDKDGIASNYSCS